MPAAPSLSDGTATRATGFPDGPPTSGDTVRASGIPVDSSTHGDPVRASGIPVEPPVPVAGVVPFSSVDWPGKLVATAFLQGCPWRCPYCHNPALQDTAAVGAANGDGVDGGTHDDAGGGATNDADNWHSLIDLLEQRRGLLDGVVFTGGEPTMHRGLGAAIDVVREMGFGVGLHTNGCYPDALDHILDGHRPDWIGLDVKADPRDPDAYGRVAFGDGDGVGKQGAGDRARCGAGGKVLRSLRAAVASGVDVEVRTTVWPDSPAAAAIPGIAELLGDLAPDAAASLTWAIQKARPDGVAAPGIVFDRPGWTAEFERLVRLARDGVAGAGLSVVAR